MREHKTRDSSCLYMMILHAVLGRGMALNLHTGLSVAGRAEPILKSGRELSRVSYRIRGMVEHNMLVYTCNLQSSCNMHYCMHEDKPCVDRSISARRKRLPLIRSVKNAVAERHESVSMCAPTTSM